MRSALGCEGGHCSVWLRALGTAALIPQNYTAGAGRGCQRNSSWTSIARPRLPIRPDVPNVHVEYLFIVKGGGEPSETPQKTQATLRLRYLNKNLVKCQNTWDPVGQPLTVATRQSSDCHILQ